MKRQTLKPAEGRRVREADGTLLPAEGKTVPLNTYWRRRIKHGDVVPVNATKNPTKQGKTNESNSNNGGKN